MDYECDVGYQKSEEGSTCLKIESDDPEKDKPLKGGLTED
jgi:hypothetical protein